MKAEVYEIFTDIQTRTNTFENLNKLTNIFEKNNTKNFNEVIENVFLIIIKNSQKNTLVLKNIKEFLKSFLSKIVKSSKTKEQSKKFINHFCKLFTSNVKKNKYKTLCIFFLNIFLNPYSNNCQNYYDSETLEQIKIFILNILKSKQTSLHSHLLKLLQRHTILQKEKEIWERLENLLDNSNQNIKKEILKLLEIDNQNILNYLLEMYDDESAEIRNFVYEKLSDIKNFDLIDANKKVKLFYVGLSDMSNKVQVSAKKLLKNYLYSIGIYKSKKNDEDTKMEVDSELNTFKNSSKDSDKSEEKDIHTAHDKIIKSNSPLKLNKKKLVDAPSRILDQLDIIAYYNHPKYSCTFQLITEAIIEFTDEETLTEFYRNIIDNMILISNSQSEIEFKSPKKIVKKLSSSDGKFISTGRKKENNALFNDIYFLQNSINYISNNPDKNSNSLKGKLLEMLPDNKTFANILNHFYINDSNILILHQLFLISVRLNYPDEIGNREIMNFVKLFVMDTELHRKTISDVSLKSITSPNMDVHNSMYSNPDEVKEESNLPITEQNTMKNSIENMLLPYTRRVVLSMEDLVEPAMKILLKIHHNQHNQLFSTVMELVHEIGELLESSHDSISNLKSEQKNLIEQIKEKIAVISELEDKKNKEKGKRVEYDRKIHKEQDALNNLDEKLFIITENEKYILMRKIKLCEFLIKYCRVPPQFYDPMVQNIILPCVQRKEFPEVMRLSYNSMGLLSINFHNSSYKNFLKLFYDQLDKKSHDEFKEIERISLFIIFDSMLTSNVNELGVISGNVEEIIDVILKRYLYHQDLPPRIIAFTGLSKLLIANRVVRPEFIISRLLIVLYHTLDLNCERSSEEYNAKIYEITQNFLYTYCVSDKNNVYTILKAMMISLTAKMIGESIADYERTAVQDYKEVKYEFLKQLIYLISEFSMDKEILKKIVFKIFKFMYYLYGFTIGDSEKDSDNDNNNNLKKIRIKYKNKNSIKMNLVKFFEKTKFDIFLINEISEENFLIKFFPFLLKFNDYIPLKNLSEEVLYKHYEIMNTKNFVYEFSDRTLDLGNESKVTELKNYVENKRSKYYKMIEEYCHFIISLKNDKFNSIPEENSGLEDEESFSQSKNKNISADKSVLSESVLSSNVSKMRISKDNEVETDRYKDDELSRKKILSSPSKSKQGQKRRISPNPPKKTEKQDVKRRTINSPKKQENKRKKK